MNKTFEFGEEAEIICEREGIMIATSKSVEFNTQANKNSLSIAGEILFDKTTKELFECDEESLILPFDIIIKKDKPITLSNVELLTSSQFDEEGNCIQQKIELDSPIIFVARSVIGVE